MKRIGGRKYAYLVYRRGTEVVQEYLGPAEAPSVVARISAMEKSKSLPPRLYKLFWDTDPCALNVRRHGRYIIERILDFGDLDDFTWAQKQYPSALLLEVCTTSRRVSERSKVFWSLWLGENYAP